MIWVTWRQLRAQAWVAWGALAAAAIALAVTGAHVASLYDTSGIASCQAHGDCGGLAGKFLTALQAGAVDEVVYQGGVVFLLALPGVIGVFWGAPMVTREFETGTFRLAWNQGVTRTRWLAVKTGLTGLVAMATAGLLSLMVTWWSGPVDAAGAHARAGGLGRFAPLLFAARGITPVGYAAFALSLGIAAGVLIRRTVPAMAATLAAFAFVQVAWPFWVRPHLIPPLTAVAALNPAQVGTMTIGSNGHMTVIGSADIPGAWIISNQTLTPSGHVFTGPATRACLSGTFRQCQAWLAGQHLRQLITYQPASRYWEFQWLETGIFLALALALAGLCGWWIRRRRVA